MVMMCWDCVENARLCYTISAYLCMNNDCCGEIQTSACLSVDTHTPTSSKKSISITRRPSRHKHRHMQEHTQHKPKEKRYFFLLFTVVWLVFHPCLTLFQLIDWLRTSLLLCQQTYYWIFDLWMVCLLLLRSYFCDRWGRRLMEAVIQFVPPVNFILLC